MYSGRFSFEKRVDLLIEAFAKIHSKYPLWTLTLFGEGPLESYLKSAIESFNIKEKVSILRESSVEGMYRRYLEHHVIVLTSKYEGCPLSIREGMANGLVPVAFDDCSGINEIIVNKENGLLADGRDPVVSLAVALEEVMCSDTLRTQLSSKAKASISRFDPDVINKKWIDMVMSALRQVEVFDYNNCSNSSLRHFRKYLYALKYQGKHASDILEFSNEPLTKLERLYYALLSESPLFDNRFYLETYYHVKEKGEDPLLHYINEGWLLGYNPSENFCTVDYISKYQLHDLNYCPLVYFYLFGWLIGHHPIHTGISRSPASFTTVPLRKEWQKDTDAVLKWMQNNEEWEI
ncbi:glycosyltransferase [Allochromatium vinosum]|uniref:glycosyltransferase n=1 Tax=Allochromatium vinosum TaxID=1049 RepID=UPI001CBACE2E|nr:glycosyltransferase [Allochromatium vinosum]